MLTILKLDSFYRKWGIIMGKYFGTDGVRGVAGADLTCELAMKIGRGAAAVLTGSTGHAAHTVGPKVFSHNNTPLSIERIKF